MALFRLRAPNQTFPAGALAYSAMTCAWLYACAIALVNAVANPQKFSMALLLALMIAPIALLKLRRVPVYLLGLYGMIVPFTDLLATNAGPTYTNLLGIVTGIVLVVAILIKRQVVAPSRWMFVVVVLAIYMGATVFWAIDPAAALGAFKHYLSLIMLFVLISLYPITRSDAKIVLGGAVIGGILVAAYADFLFWHAQTARVYLGTSDHSIDPNDMAASLLVPIAVALTMFLGARGRAKVAWLGALLVLVTGFASSGSRGAAFGMAAIGIFLLFRSKYKVQVAAVACAIVVFILTSAIGHRFTQSDVSNADGRIDVWRIGVASLHQYWLGGAGVGNFNQAFRQYFLTVPHPPLLWDRVAHSVIVGTAVELGIPGLLLTIALWYGQFRALAHTGGDGRWTDICLGLRAGLLGLFVSGFSLSIMWLKYPWLAFALIAVTRSALKRTATLDSL